MLLTSLYSALLNLKIWATTYTLSRPFSVTAAVVAPAVGIYLNSLMSTKRVALLTLIYTTAPLAPRPRL